VNKIILTFIFIFLASCSLNKNSKLWNEKDKEVIKEKKQTKILVEEKKELKELNAFISLNLSVINYNNKITDNLNNFGSLKYNGSLNKIGKYNFSKLVNFNQFNSEPLILNDGLIIFDKKGTILRYNDNQKITWKNNFYSKSEKKLNPLLTFATNGNNLLVADNISNIFSIDIFTGNLIWSQKSNYPFNSQIKIYKDKFFIVDDSNILKCFSLSDGSLIWEFKTQDALIRSQKKVSLALKNNKIIFSSTIGDLTAVDVETGKLVWQTPTRSNRIIEETMFLKISDIIIGGNSIFFSNNENEFFSIDEETGILNWKQNINSSLRPAYIDDLIFTVTEEGFLIVIESNTGNIIRSTYLFESIKEKKRKKINPIGFIVGKKNIYLSTNIGRLFVIDILSGKTQSVIKIDNKKISRPKVLNQNLYIAKDNSIVKLN